MDEDHSSARLPDRIAFAYGSAQLDPNGWTIAILQAQRASQLYFYDGVLSCGWSAEEAAALGRDAARDLAAARCQAVMDVYQAVSSRIRLSIRLRQSPPRDLSVDADTTESFARLNLVPSGRGRAGSATFNETAVFSHYRSYPPDIPSIYGDAEFRLYFRPTIEFSRDSASLSTNARALMQLIADVSFPRDENIILITCNQAEGEGGLPPDSSALAQQRCQTLRAFLIQRGLCEYRVLSAPHSAFVTRKDSPRATRADFEIYDHGDWTFSGQECQ